MNIEVLEQILVILILFYFAFTTPEMKQKWVSSPFWYLITLWGWVIFALLLIYAAITGQLGV